MAHTDDQAETILDRVDDIRVPGDVFSRPVNEYAALRDLWAGMEFLYRQVLQQERAVREQLGPTRHLLLPADLEGINTRLLVCAFHWYCTTACQYVRTVGTIAKEHDGSRPDQSVYLSSVIPRLRAFRDTVSAHFAWTMGDSRDTEAEQEISKVPQLRYNGERLYAGGLRVQIRRQGRWSNANLEPWVLTEKHEELENRYLNSRP